MKTPTIALATLVLALGICGAQEEPREGAPKIDLEERKRSIPILEGHLKDREARLTEMANDIIRLDKRVEGQIDKIVKRLASIKDSQKSGYRVSQIKMQAMEGLKKTIDRYQSKRAAVIQEIREGRTDIPKEVLEGDAKTFDKYIEKRIEQILQISKSFTQDADVKKYEQVSGGSYYGGGVEWSYATEGISDEYRQNRRDRTMDKKQRNELTEALKKAIRRKEQQIAAAKDSLANRRMSQADRELLESEMNRDIAILDRRKGQLEELLMVPAPGTTAVSRDTALDLQDALRDASDDLRQDLDTIFVKYSELNRERSKIARLKANLEARKKWIADYEAKQGAQGAQGAPDEKGTE